MIESPACYTKKLLPQGGAYQKLDFKKGNITTKKLWGRFGADIDLTEEEYNQIVGKGVKTKIRYHCNNSRKGIQRGNLRGETYFPEKSA